MPNMKEESRKIYGIVGVSPTHQEIQVGAIQRIADAVEKMAEDRNSIERSLKHYKELAESRYHEVEKLKKQVAAYKGLAKRKKYANAR